MTKDELILKSGSFIECLHSDRLDSITVREGIVRATKDCYISSRGHAYAKAFVFPIEVKEELRAIVANRQKLREALEVSIGLVFKLNNRIARGEFN